MNKILSTCPVCQGALQISVLKCPDCGLELKNNFDLSIFDRLTDEQYSFLISFLKSRGNLSEVQSEMNITYTAAKRKLDELLFSLGLVGSKDADIVSADNMNAWKIDFDSSLASEIIKSKLKDCGGHVTVYTARGLPCEIYAEPDGKTFSCDKLPINPNYDYAVFDVIVELLKSQGGSARKGNGRNFKLGEKGCEENTVVGAIAKHRGRKPGESVFDPVFVMAAVLEWADIANNGRGELILKDSYLSKYIK